MENQTVEATKAKLPRVTMEAFVTAWEGSENVAEVAEKLQRPIGSIQARASKYRAPEFKTEADGSFVLDGEGNKILVRQAIPLKAMQKGGGKKLQTQDAFALLAKLRGVDVAEIAKQSVTLGARKIARDNG